MDLQFIYRMMVASGQQPPSEGEEDVAAIRLSGRDLLASLVPLYAIINAGDWETKFSCRIGSFTLTAKPCWLKWHAVHAGKETFYVRSSVRIKGRRFTIPLHRLISSAGRGQLVDHIDGDGLNNRRSNLRLVTAAENSRNRRKASGIIQSSRYKGVLRSGRKWLAGITCDGQRFNLGSFTDEREAARAYDAKALAIFGDFARLNFPATEGLQ